MIWATADLEATAARMERDHGLRATGGGAHDGMGTHNRIVPLGGGYLELLAIADADEAGASPLGRFVDAAIEGWMGWAVVVDDVDAVAERLGTDMTVIARAGFTSRVGQSSEPTLLTRHIRETRVGAWTAIHCATPPPMSCPTTHA